jgi:hypothetical protein
LHVVLGSKVALSFVKQTHYPPRGAFTMKYLMLVCSDPSFQRARDEDAPDVNDWVREMDGNGIRVIGSRTRPASDATTVRVRNREVLLTDGPYAETKDLIAGFDVLECSDLDQAIEVASKHPAAWTGVLELRPFWPLDAD